MSREKEGFRDQYVEILRQVGEKNLLSMSETAAFLGMSRQHVAGLKDLPTVKIGKRKYVSSVALARFLSR